MHGNLMYVKLALCNVRRTAKDYLIYGITLVLSIGMFYGFYSLGSPYYSAALPVRMHLNILRQVMRIAVPLVGLLSVFLISYVNAYMFRQKQKEFAVESILGMEQGTVAVLFFLETLSMGAAAVILGILLGVLLSQGISILVVQSFEEIYRLHFTVFPDTLLGTILFFGLLFLMMGLRNVWLIRRRKVIEMLQDSQNGTDVRPLPKQLGRWAAAGTAVSAAVFGMMVFLINDISAYPKVLFRVLIMMFLAAGFMAASACFFLAGKRRREGSRPMFVMMVCSMAEGALLLASFRIFETLVGQGRAPEIYVTAPPVCGFLLLAFSMAAFFGNLTWFLSKVIRKPSRAYYQNLFLVGQIRSRMGSRSKTMGMITCVLTASLILFAWLPVLAARIESYQHVLSVFDVQVGTMYPAEESAFPTGTLDYDAITEYLEQSGCPVTGTAQGETYFLEPADPEHPEADEGKRPSLAVPLSVYNDLRRLSGLAPVRLAADEYGVAWDNEALESDIRNLAQEGHTIQAGEYRLFKAEGADYQDPVGISLFTCQTAFVYVIPDDAVQGLQMATTFYSANTARPLSYEFARQFEQEIGDYQRNLDHFPPEYAFVRLNTLQTSEGTSTMLMLNLIGAYAALVLLVSSFTMLSVQQLTDAAEQKKRFGIIGKLGVEPGEIKRNIRQQMYFWFGLPVLAALIGSAGVLAYLVWSGYRTIAAYISLGQIGLIFAGVYTVFLLILGCYFTATYSSVCASVSRSGQGAFS